MWWKKIILKFLTISILLTLVKASCLEYGHSCWGAHGKRSMNILHAESKPISDEKNYTPNKGAMESSSILLPSYPTRLLRYRDNEDIDDDDMSDNDELKQYSSSISQNDVSSHYWQPNANDYNNKKLQSILPPLNRRLEYLDKSLMKHKKFARQLHKRLMQRLEFNDDDNELL